MDEEAQFSTVDRRCRQQGGNQLPDCHPFWHIWPASKLAILRSLTRVYWRLQSVSIGLNGTFLHADGMRRWALYTRKQITCLRIFRFLVAQRATGQRRTLVQVQRDRLKLPTRRWKRKWPVASCSWYAKLGTLHTEKNYLLANRSFVRGAEGDGQTYPSFTAENGLINASSSSLEAPIATFYMRGRCKRGRFHNGKQILVCRSFVYRERRGRRGNVALS